MWQVFLGKYSFQGSNKCLQEVWKFGGTAIRSLRSRQGSCSRAEVSRLDQVQWHCIWYSSGPTLWQCPLSESWLLPASRQVVNMSSASTQSVNFERRSLGIRPLWALHKRTAQLQLKEAGWKQGKLGIIKAGCFCIDCRYKLWPLWRHSPGRRGLACKLVWSPDWWYCHCLASASASQQAVQEWTLPVYWQSMCFPVLTLECLQNKIQALLKICQADQWGELNLLLPHYWELAFKRSSLAALKCKGKPCLRQIASVGFNCAKACKQKLQGWLFSAMALKK